MDIEHLPKHIQEILSNEKFSRSEKNGISLLTNDELQVYSPCISTGGIAEIKMALLNPKRKIVATTIDFEGVKEVEGYIQKAGFNKQIRIKNEDVSETLPYWDNTFDYIYARLVLHYLTVNKLNNSLRELNRILKPEKKIFIVVRSTDDPDTKTPGVSYDRKTCLTTYPWMDGEGKIHPKELMSRYFHTRESITKHLLEAEFNVVSVEQYNEQLYLDFSRKKLSPIVGNLIEVVAKK